MFAANNLSSAIRDGGQGIVHPKSTVIGLSVFLHLVFHSAMKPATSRVVFYSLEERDKKAPKS